MVIHQAKPLRDLIVAIKGAGDLASGLAWRLYQARIRRIYMLEVPKPLSVRRRVAFSEAVYDGLKTVEGVTAQRIDDNANLQSAWSKGHIAVRVDPKGNTIHEWPPNVLVDAIMAKKNLGTRIEDAPLVIGLGPGFTADKDVHRIIETHRGSNLGRLIDRGCALPDTAIPGTVGGYSSERLLRSPASGVFQTTHRIGEQVQKGETVAMVNGQVLKTAIDGVIRGLIRPGIDVTEGLKVGDIDPRGPKVDCDLISDKARALGGALLEAILHAFNR
ncbi:MAG: selenium-dependent molybdenum cofactor biosynthesis protein YqeB [Thermodesulfobacteriota bacterium]